MCLEKDSLEACQPATVSAAGEIRVSVAKEQGNRRAWQPSPASTIVHFTPWSGSFVNIQINSAAIILLLCRISFPEENL